MAFLISFLLEFLTKAFLGTMEGALVDFTMGVEDCPIWGRGGRRVPSFLSIWEQFSASMPPLNHPLACFTNSLEAALPVGPACYYLDDITVSFSLCAELSLPLLLGAGRECGRASERWRDGSGYPFKLDYWKPLELAKMGGTFLPLGRGTLFRA